MENTKRTPVEKEFVCEMCGNTFKSFANHAKYCKYCRDTRSLQRAKNYRDKKQTDSSRKIGSEQICPECGKAYILKSGNQKVCDECRKIHHNKIKSTANTRYKKKNYDSCVFYVKKGKRQEYQNWASQHKMSLNELCNTAVEQYIENTDKANKFKE